MGGGVLSAPLVLPKPPSSHARPHPFFARFPTAATADIVPGSLDVTPAGQVVFSLALNDLPGVDGNSLSLAWGSAAVDPDDVIPSCDAGTASTYAVAVDFDFMVANSHSVDENVPNDASQTDDSQPDTVTAFDRYTSIVEATWTENSVEPRSGTAVTRTVSQVCMPFTRVAARARVLFFCAALSSHAIAV